VAAIKVYSVPDDGRKGRPKNVEHTCSFNKHNTARLASCWFIIYYILGQLGESPVLKKQLRENLLRPKCIKEMLLYLQTDIFNKIIDIIVMIVRVFKKEKKKNDAVALWK